MLGADFGCCGGDEACQCGDELACFVEVLEVVGVFVCREAALDGCGAHHVDGCGADDFDGGYVCDVAQLFVDGFDLLFGEFGVAVYGGFFFRGEAETRVFSAHSPRISYFVCFGKCVLKSGCFCGLSGGVPAIFMVFCAISLRLSGILRYGCRQFASGACLPPG